MNIIADVKVTDVGPLGAELQAPNGPKPRHCPGLGGWKRDPQHEGCWITRLKGSQASALLARVDPSFPYVDINVGSDGGSFSYTII